MKIKKANARTFIADSPITSRGIGFTVSEDSKPCAVSLRTEARDLHRKLGALVRSLESQTFMESDLGVMQTEAGTATR